MSNNFLGRSSFTGPGTLNSIRPFALNGQAGFEGPVNHDTYAAFDRVISDPFNRRVGSGVGSATIGLLP
ncbi:MAG TPA: hypothetical protein VE262_17125 [Blastocatellia bacterium]|nr:hypothetical protein [Blastocatellia bacterium]